MSERMTPERKRMLRSLVDDGVLLTPMQGGWLLAELDALRAERDEAECKLAAMTERYRIALEVGERVLAAFPRGHCGCCRVSAAEKCPHTTDYEIG